MYLQSIELQGFKSFPDRTKLDFEPGTGVGTDGRGVTVIVGPNGSGKSNIADAMRWVLGEISSKTLRGSKMEDVIFGGADSRRPMGYAEVSVTFDNTSDFCRLDCPYDRVTVTRRYFRSGESEYLINRKPVRLRDIYELFLNTGIGRDGYSIIGQGRIAEMISRKSEERRSVFEDASGIARYRVRKTEAQRRLDTTEANMVRIRDVFSEVEAQVGPLAREAEKAKKGIVLLEARRQADISLWLYDSGRLLGEIEAAATTRSHAEFDLSQAQDALQSLEVQNQRLTEMNRGSRETAGQLTGEITAVSEELHRLDSEYRVRESHILHAGESIGAAEEAIRAAYAARDDARARERDHREKEASLRRRLTEMEAEYAAGTAEQETLRRRIDELSGRIDVTGADIRAREAQAVDVRVRLSVLENARNSGSDRGSGILSDMERYEETAASLAADVARRQKGVDGYTASLNENDAALRAAENALTACNEQYGQAHEALNTAKLRRDSVAQRIQTFRSMEEHYEGYTGAVRFVMSRYAAGRLSGFGGEPCGTVYGPLSQLVQVEKAYVTAVETALGANLQHIVVENEATAKAAMYALKRENAGRATFFPLTSMRGQSPTPEMTQAAGYPGYVAVADALLTSDDRFRSVLSSLLGRTLVFDTIDHATAMAKALRYRVRVVTLDGQQINVGGSFTGGSTSQRGGALSRAAEVRALTEEQKRLDGQVSEAEQELIRLRDAVREAEEQRDAKQDRRDLLRAVLGNETAALNQAKAKQDANRTLLDKLRDDSDRILAESRQYEQDMESLRAEEAALTAAIGEVRAVRQQADADRGDAEDALNSRTEKQTGLYIALSEARKDADTQATFADSCAEQAGKAEADAAAAQERIAALTESRTGYRREQEENRRLYADGEQRLAALSADKSRADADSAQYELRLTALREQINRKYEDKETLFRAFTTADTKLTGLRAEKEKLDAKLHEDYDMTLPEAQTMAEAMHWEPVTPENRREVLATQTDCRNRLRALGHFDPDAVEKYKEVYERCEAMRTQIADLEKSRAELTGIIARLEDEMKVAFATAFDAINENFGKTFAELFGGGSAEVSLTDPDNILESGIEIKAAPPGKIIKSLMQLSGGEQAFVGVALFFAILKVNPTPFCILDEIEAALDEVNVERLAQYIRRYADETQFIMITHRRGTMAAATRLYGVTMPEHGISKVLTLDVADISKNKEGSWNGLFN